MPALHGWQRRILRSRITQTDEAHRPFHNAFTALRNGLFIFGKEHPGRHRTPHPKHRANRGKHQAFGKKHGSFLKFCRRIFGFRHGIFRFHRGISIFQAPTPQVCTTLCRNSEQTQQEPCTPRPYNGSHRAKASKAAQHTHR